MRTKTIDVNGAIMTATQNLARCTVTVRWTADEVGKTLSLQAGNVMIVVPFEQVEKLIAEGGDENN